MVFPRKSGNKLKEPSLPSLSLACQFPQHPVSPGRDKAVPTLGSMTVVTVECNCIQGMQIYGADFRLNTCRVHMYIYICVCVKQTRLKPATPDGYLASGWFGGSG